MPTESPTLGFTHLQFEALLTAARESPNPSDFALVTMLGLLGLRIFEATGTNIGDLGEEHSHRVLRVCGKGAKVVLIPLPPAVGRAIDRAIGRLLLTLIRNGKPYVGIGSHPGSRWLFPGLLPGRPITPARLAERLRDLGIPAKAGRRAALIDLAAQLPAAVLADLLGLHPTTAVTWMHQAGGDWSHYAAQLAQTTITNHEE